jgi:cytochrome c biogenesis protein
VFHSWWFSFSVLLLAANLIACSIERLPRIFFDAIRPRPYLTERRLLGLTLKKNFIVSDLKVAHHVVKVFFGAVPSRVQLKFHPTFFFKEYFLLGRFGVYVVHIALLIIMFSSIYATQNGVDGHVMIEEGKSSRFITAKGAGGVNYTHDLGFFVGCRDFRLRTFVDNSPMEFESDLVIHDDKISHEIEKTVRVNEPLSHAGFTFYQSSFRPVISEKIVDLKISNKNGYESLHQVHLNSEIKLPNGDVLVAKKIFEDFAGLGQALRIQKTDIRGHSTYFHIFRKYPDYDQEVRADDFAVTFLGADQQYATGLSVGYVPGISVIFIGFLILVLGLALCFFTSPRRYFARILKTDDGIEVILAAQGFRNPASVREDFLRRIASAQAHVTEMNNAQHTFV